MSQFSKATRDLTECCKNILQKQDENKFNLTTQQPLIIRLPNWIGDVIMTIPSLFALRSAGFKLELYGQKWILDLLSTFKSNLYEIPTTICTAQQALKRNPTKRALLFTNSFSSALSMRLAFKKVIGFQTDSRRFLLNKGMLKPIGLHEVETYWQIAKLAAHTWIPDCAWPKIIPKKITLPIDFNQLKKVTVLLKKHQIHEPFVMLCPMATGKNKHKQIKIWPHWQALSLYLAQQNIPTLCAPGPDELTPCLYLLPHTKCIETLNLSALAALMSRSHFVIANDTGQMHIASACSTHVLGIFGTTDPHRTKPWGEYFLGEEGRWPSLDEVIASISIKK